MRLISLLIAALMGALAQAATPPPPATDELGRLFFTSAERAELDRIRVGIQDSNDPSHAARTVRLDGIVQASGKAPVLWINGGRYKGQAVAGANITTIGSSASTLLVTMPPPDPRDTVLKVGQTLDPAGGNLREVYQRPPQELNQLLQLLSRRGPKRNLSTEIDPKTPAAQPPAGAASKKISKP